MSERDELAALIYEVIDHEEAADPHGAHTSISSCDVAADTILARWRLVPNTEIPGYGPELTALPPGTVLIDKRGDAAVVTEFGLEFPGVPNYMGADVAWPAIVVWTPENPARDE